MRIIKKDKCRIQSCIEGLMGRVSTEPTDKRYKERLNKLTSDVFDPHSAINIDALLDCYNALFHELNVKAINNNKNLLALFNRISKTNEYICQQRINLNDFTVLKVLGKGAFGEVSLVKHNETSGVYALKAMNKYEMIKREEGCCLWEEREIMALSQTDWVVKMFYAFQDHINIYMVMEFVQGGDMVNFMSTYDVDENIARFYLAEISVALDFIHNLGFIHRDIKPDNMLLDRMGHIKLCDFGTCIRMDKNGKVSSNVAVGTPDYISPEILTSQNSTVPYGKEADWWSVGVFVYEFIVGDTPFYAQSLVGTYSNIMNYKKSLSIPEDVDMSKEYKDLIHAFLCEPSKRLGSQGLNQVKSHPFFKSIDDWNNLRTKTPPIVLDFSDDLDTSCFEDIEDSGKGTGAAAVPSKCEIPFRGDHFPFVGFSFSKDFALPSQPKLVESNSVKATLKKQQADTTNIESAKSKEYLKEIDELKSVIVQKEKLLKESEETIKQDKIHCDELEERFKQLSKQNAVTIELREENNRILNKVQTLEAEINTLLENSKKLEVSLKFSKITESETKARYEELMNQLSTLKDQMETLNKQKTQLENEMSTSSDKLKDASSVTNQFKAKFEEAKKENDALSSHICALKNIFENNSIETILNLIKSNKNEVAQLKTKVNSYENDIKNYEEILAKQASMSDVENMQLSRKYNLVISERDSLLAYIEENESKSKELLEKCDAMTRQVRILTNENIALEYKVKELTSKYTSYTLNEVKFTKERAELIEKNKELVETLGKINLLARSSELKISQFEEQIAYNETRINNQNQQLDGYKTSILNHEQHITELKMQIDDLQYRSDTLNLSVNTKQEEINKLKLKLNDLELENSNITKQLEELKCEHAQKIDQNSVGSNDEIGATGLIHMAEIERLKLELSDLNDKYCHLKATSSKQIEAERIRKEEAVKKLNQVMSMGAGQIGTISSASKKDKTVISKTDRKMENLYKQLQMDFQKETERHANAVKDYEKRIDELNVTISELRTQAEQNNKFRNSTVNSHETGSQASLSTMSPKFVGDSPGDASTIDSQLILDSDTIIKQSFLFIPSKALKSSRKLNWTRVVATLTNRNLTLYKDGNVNVESILYCINIESIYYVRAISQNDLIRSTANDIVKIFQVIYNDETVGTEMQQTEVSGEKCIIVSNHCFVNIQYHMPTTCDVCGKGLWGFIKSSFALECKNCHFRCHKEHIQEPKSINGCRDYDKRHMAKEILLMAASTKEQQCWIDLIISLIKNIATAAQQQQTSSTLSRAQTAISKNLGAPPSPSQSNSTS